MNALIRETTTRALIDELKSRNYVVCLWSWEDVLHIADRGGIKLLKEDCFEIIRTLDSKKDAALDIERGFILKTVSQYIDERNHLRIIKSK
jgi:hypothetical protein